MNIVYSSASLQIDENLLGKKNFTKEETQKILQTSKNFGKMSSKVSKSNMKLNLENGELLIFKTVLVP